MLVDQVIEVDAVAAFVRLFGVTSLSSGRHCLRQKSFSEPRPRLLRPGSPARHRPTPTQCQPLCHCCHSYSSSSSSVPPRRFLASSFNRTVGRPVKDMIREELDQEQDFNDDLDLDSDSDVDNEDSIIARIQYFLGENDDTLRAKDRKQRNRIFRAVHNGKFEVVLNNFIDSSPSTYPTPLSTANHGRRRPIRAHDEARQQGAKQPDRRWRSSASRWSSDTSGASVEDLRSAPTPSLLPMARYAPKSVRELPRAFSLKNMSEGNGGGRFTKLVKTMLSDIRADERNVVRILVKPPHGRGAWEREEKGGENEDHPQDG
ncbi:hypothetical protein EDB89DRAFT_2068025 [Lactarius sanguifluus]|nr:hypothetical protein EDB89DRAFT_2068025 [Lactarius sanguifluus]